MDAQIQWNEKIKKKSSMGTDRKTIKKKIINYHQSVETKELKCENIYLNHW